MMQSETQPVPPPGDEAPSPQARPAGEGLAPLLADVKRLGSEARTLAEAELAYQTSRAKVAASGAAKVAILGVLAAVLAFFALMGLVMGAILSLATLVGPLAATAIVVAVLLVLAFVCVVLLRKRLARTMALVFPAEAP